MSTYNPRRQGRRDALGSKPRFLHKSEWNQREYDAGYMQGTAELVERIQKENSLREQRDQKLFWDKLMSESE